MPNYAIKCDSCKFHGDVFAKVAELDDRGRVVADADCHLEVGGNPTATTGSVIKLTAGSAEYFGVTPGHKIAVIKA